MKTSPSTRAAIIALCKLDDCTRDHLITSALCLYAVESQGVAWARRFFPAARTDGNP